MKKILLTVAIITLLGSQAFGTQLVNTRNIFGTDDRVPLQVNQPGWRTIMKTIVKPASWTAT